MPAAKAQFESNTEIGQVDQLVYCSLASPDLSELRLSSQLINNASGITGLLIWEGKLIIHWLEGSAQQIQSLWAQVQSDEQQHCVVRLMYRQAAAKSLFANWQMRLTNRKEMMGIVREIKELASKDKQSDAQAQEWQHAISTLSILLDPELTRFYAQPAQAIRSESTRSPELPREEEAAC